LDLNYDQLRDIRFRTDKSLWRQEGLPFQVQFFHPGFIFNKTVTVNAIDDRKVSLVPFSKDLFDYGKNNITQPIPENIGFSGFRIHYPLNKPDYLDELAVFQGASYFRMLAVGQQYGISARGLALNCAEPVPEEFPVFEEFWLEQPKRLDQQLTLYSLMNSKSVTGAFRFIIHPGTTTMAEVKATLYIRKPVKTFGIAPLTSMFWYGENSGTTYGDFRPEVHDSDGLLMQTGTGEWIWRPLCAEKHLRISAFMDRSPKGFGVLQRDRKFSSYEDLEAFYHIRPSVWIEPVGDWGPGHVRLVELPTPDETNDNIVAFWVSEKKLEAGDVVNLEYKMYWFMDEPRFSPAGRVLSTRIGNIPQAPNQRKIVIDFQGEKLAQLPPQIGVEAVPTVGSGASLVSCIVQKNAVDQNWRAVLCINVQNKKNPIELRCFLKDGNNILTETWTYQLTP
jgi:glucans biosynthesis protein